jgi:hypothetical protein
LYLLLIVGGQQTVRHRNSLDDKQRYVAYVTMHMLCMRNGGKFKKNDKKEIASFFQCDIQIIQRIWRTAMRQIAEGLEIPTKLYKEALKFFETTSNRKE